jgi:hypothetical protein
LSQVVEIIEKKNGTPNVSSRSRVEIALSIASAVVVAAIVAMILVPMLLHYRVSVSPPPPTLVSELRANPSDEVLAEAARGDFIVPYVGDADAAVAAANQLLEGAYVVPGSDRRIQLSFDAADLEKGSPSEMLIFASLLVPHILVTAYENTHDERYLQPAAKFIDDFANYERNSVFPRGYLWNDHAIAARVGVVIQFWKSYRKSANYRETIAADVILHAERCAAFLARPDHFTYATNHGVMQNIALLQFSLSFPGFAEDLTYRDLAIRRLDEQIKYYVNDEGVVLEHSAGYHAGGVMLLGAAIHLGELNGVSIARQWREKYDKSRRILEEMLRPDGSLPMFGDTSELSFSKDLPSGRDAGERGVAPWFSLYPVAGYAMWRNLDANGSTMAQCVVIWSYFVGHGHKLADELSLLVWGHGRSWITNSGYWPYGRQGREDATGWRGGNAPHWRDESRTNARDTRLRGFSSNDGIVALDLARSTTKGDIQRQVVSIDGGTWLVLDISRSADPNASVETLWTFPPDLALAPSGDDAYVVSDPLSRASMQIELWGASGHDAKDLRGNRDPFAGWVVQDGVPTPAPALLLNSSAGSSWLATVFSIAPTTLARGDFEFHDDQNWRWASALGRSATRKSGTVTVTDASRVRSLEFEAPAPVAQDRAAIQRDLAAAASQYPSYRDLDFYRTRLAIYAFCAWLLQEFALVAARATPMSRWMVQIRIASLIAWMCAGAWIEMVYFS